MKYFWLIPVAASATWAAFALVNAFERWALKWAGTRFEITVVDDE